jgi:hypothetical protein
MTGFDVSGWIPQWAPARDQLKRQRLNLRALHRHRIVDSWLVWDLQHDTWFADLPVVLMFDHGEQLEVSWQKFDDLSITWNTIDTKRTPIAWVDWPLTWRPQGHAALRAITRQTITSTAATEHRFVTRQIAPPTNDEHSTWLVGGIWLGTDAGGLHIFNALDENGLSGEMPSDGPDNRRLHL